MSRDPEIRLHGRSYKASFFVEILERLGHKPKDRPSFLQELAAAAKEVVRRDQEHQSADNLRSVGGESERHGKGDHADPTYGAVMEAETQDRDVVHENAVKFCEHIIEMDNHARAAHAAWTRLNAYSRREGRESSLIECANSKCDKEMSGIGEDRAKDGRCERCYRFRRRTGRDWTPNAIDGEDAA